MMIVILTIMKWMKILALPSNSTKLQKSWTMTT